MARIQHGTEIVPKGLFEIDEETNEQKYAEEFAIPGTDELKSLEAWSHALPQILKAGRCTHAEIYPEGMEDDAKEEYMSKLKEDDPEAERFRALTDETYKKLGTEEPWSSKIAGDAQ